MHEHPGHDAGRPVAQPGERDAERDEHDQRLEKPVRETEGDADDENRLPAAEEAQQRLTGAAKGQLLDERRDRGEQEEVGGEGTCVRGLPVDVRDSLLLAGALRER